jgi:predicted RNase H-like nuclease (RuvC/YqgF family)
MWKYIFSKKEQKMNDTTTTKAVKLLEGNIARQDTVIKNQDNRITSMQMRISSLVDENNDLKSQLTKFKENVAEDIKFLYNKLT